MDKYLGKRLDGRYEMRELIGVGGMAYVYKAYDAVDDRVVAVKILREEYLTNEEFVRRFRNESKAIAILNHPNIVKVLDVGFGERLQYIVMEHIDGITLKEYLDQRKDLRWKEAVHFTIQILRALQHAHDKGIVHRDIKPQNIMLLSDGTIKVTDFGIARLTRSEMRSVSSGDKAIGSVHYISPEQARAEITDEKADLYSVGIMMYEMLTGRLPFEADNAVSVAIMQMQSDATIPHLINEDIPEGLEQITLKAMQKDTAKRYQSAAEMLSDIDEFKRNPSIKFEYTYFEDETPTRYVDAITRIRGNSDEEEEAGEEIGNGKNKGNMMLIILGIVAALVVFGAALFMFLYFGNGLFSEKKEEIRVDDFIGMDYEEEVKLHENIGNYEITLEQEYNGDYDAGVIFKQDPTPGSKIKKWGRLTLYVSKGSKLAEIPEMNPGESVNMIRSRLVKEGFEVEEVEESSTEFKKGLAIRISPESGEKVQYGSLITLYVSSGPPKSEPIEMPNVEGAEKGDAIDMLVDAGFERSKIKIEEVNDSTKAGTVVSVTPDHEEKQLPDTKITLYVSTGFADVEIEMELPDVNYAIDLKFYIGGKENTKLSKEFSGIKPKEFAKNGKITFTVSEADEEYKVSVSIAKAGADAFKNYAVFKVFGEKGKYKLEDKFDFVTTQKTQSTTTTEKPTTTTKPTKTEGSTTADTEKTTTTTESTTASTTAGEDTTTTTTTGSTEKTTKATATEPDATTDDTATTESSADTEDTTALTDATGSNAQDAEPTNADPGLNQAEIGGSVQE